MIEKKENRKRNSMSDSAQRANKPSNELQSEKTEVNFATHRSPRLRQQKLTSDDPEITAHLAALQILASSPCSSTTSHLHIPRQLLIFIFPADFRQDSNHPGNCSDSETMGPRRVGPAHQADTGESGIKGGACTGNTDPGPRGHCAVQTLPQGTA